MTEESIAEIVKKIRKHDIEFSEFSQTYEADFALSEYNAIRLLSEFVGIYEKNPGNIEQQIRPDKAQDCVCPDVDIICGWKRSTGIVCKCPTGPCRSI